MPKLKQSGSEHVKIALLAMVSDPHQAQVMYFLPLEKNRIIITIEKFFELSIYEKNSLYDKFNINYDKYETARLWINRYRIRYQKVLDKYKNDPEYQTIEKIQSVQQVIKKNKNKNEDDNNIELDHTVDNFYV